MGAIISHMLITTTVEGETISSVPRVIWLHFGCLCWSHYTLLVIVTVLSIQLSENWKGVKVVVRGNPEKYRLEILCGLITTAYLHNTHIKSWTWRFHTEHVSRECALWHGMVPYSLVGQNNPNGVAYSVSYWRQSWFERHSLNK